MRLDSLCWVMAACTPAQIDTSESVTTPPACKDVQTTPSLLEIGTGETTFIPLDDGDVLDMVHGEQGGYHVPLAAHACGVGESASLHYLGLLETGEDIVNISIFMPWQPDETCCATILDVYGYIFLYDSSLSPPDLAGQSLFLDLELLDSTGATLRDDLRVVLGPPADFSR